MKVNRLEAHDRLLHLKKEQSINIFKGAEDCLKKNRLSIGLQSYSPYVYLFAHPRTADDGVTKVMYWQPRLTKPPAQDNSYLFRALSLSDIVEVCWLIPPTSMWNQYKKGNVTEHETVNWCIDQYKNNRRELEKPHKDDLSDDVCRNIYLKVAREIDEEEKMSKFNVIEAKNETK